MDRRKQDNLEGRTVLWAENDLAHVEGFLGKLEDEGFEILTATNGAEALELLKENYQDIVLVVLDVVMPPEDELAGRDTRSGHVTGIIVGREIRRRYGAIPIIGYSYYHDDAVIQWFNRYGCGYIDRYDILHAEDDVVERIKQAASKRKPRCFIVHGHNERTLSELEKYLRNTFDLDESNRPVILREQASLGRTIIGKFEEESQGIDVVFILLTPDDKAAPYDAPDNDKRRARQNVIFELGFFYAKFQRRKGRVILLKKGEIELPSDIEGIVYIDISDGIKEADRLIRKELKKWL